MMAEYTEKTWTSDASDVLGSLVVNSGIEASSYAEVPGSLEQSIRRIWPLTGTRKLRKQYLEAAQRLHRLEQDNLSLRDKVEQLTKREASARYLANHDGLTGLCNRGLLMDRFVQASAHARHGGYPMALLLFDLDGFNAINHRFGHLVGDRLLQRVADKLREIARDGDTSCRYGADEFVLLLSGICNLAKAEGVAQRVRDSIVDCLRVDDIPIEVHASCGIALYPEDGANWHDLMEAADAAMSRAKPGNKQAGNTDMARDQHTGNRHDCARMLHALDVACDPSDPKDMEFTQPTDDAVPRPSRKAEPRASIRGS